MATFEIDLTLRSQASQDVSIETRHNEFMSALSAIDEPLGLKGLELPPPPECRGATAVFSPRLKVRGLQFYAHYLFRGQSYKYHDSAQFDDLLLYKFKSSNRAIDYKTLLRKNFPEIIAAIKPSSAVVYFSDYKAGYEGGFEPVPDASTAYDADGNSVWANAVFNQFREERNGNVDARHHIFTLAPAQFWGEALCERALGFGPRTVKSRLEGDALLVEIINDGVYLLLNDNLDMTFTEFKAMNNKFKKLLDLV
ncbi:hypothetical protein [Amantichitinum ursilacus]|uniref:Uncharacterized protein n=1 Tax=Amantichitinum ursilacus TaxID=857265 RepID=A0A0N0GNT5_9NEIS|nr:hypothetical protein [Amantichitinum ursilacus]KPC53155.1 hypothetical protein WG78_08695 [Amantichitinum ursilacus]